MLRYMSQCGCQQLLSLLIKLSVRWLTLWAVTAVPLIVVARRLLVIKHWVLGAVRCGKPSGCAGKATFVEMHHTARCVACWHRRRLRHRCLQW
jgi:hypothetical protein